MFCWSCLLHCAGSWSNLGAWMNAGFLCSLTLRLAEYLISVIDTDLLMCGSVMKMTVSSWSSHVRGMDRSSVFRSQGGIEEVAVLSMMHSASCDHHLQELADEDFGSPRCRKTVTCRSNQVCATNQMQWGIEQTRVQHERWGNRTEV